MVVMVVNSANVRLSIWSEIKTDGIDMVSLSETLEDLGGVVMVPKGMYGGGEGCGGTDEIERT